MLSTHKQGFIEGFISALMIGRATFDASKLSIIPCDNGLFYICAEDATHKQNAITTTCSEDEAEDLLQLLKSIQINNNNARQQ